MSGIDPRWFPDLSPPPGGEARLRAAMSVRGPVLRMSAWQALAGSAATIIAAVLLWTASTRAGASLERSAGDAVDRVLGRPDEAFEPGHARMVGKHGKPGALRLYILAPRPDDDA